MHQLVVNRPFATGTDQARRSTFPISQVRDDSDLSALAREGRQVYGS